MRVSVAREMRETNAICSEGFYKFGHLSFYPENKSKFYGIKWIRIEKDFLRVSDSTGVYDWLGTAAELFEHKKTLG